MTRITYGAILVTVGLAAVIGVLTLAPPTGLEMPAGSDKLSHLLAFAALALPLSVVRPRWNLTLFALCTAYGALIELIQPLVGRSREPADLLADMLGIAGGLVVALLLRRLFPGLRVKLSDAQSPQSTDEDTD